MFSTEKESNNNKVKIVIVGDEMVGKTCIGKSYAKKPYNRIYQPTICCEIYEISVTLDNKEHPILLWDTVGVEEWAELRIQDYLGVDCFILCYAIDNYTSFENIESKWYPELKICFPKIPVVLVGGHFLTLNDLLLKGTKKDLRTPSNFMITEEQGRNLSKTIKAAGFTECSKTSLSSLEGVFLLAVSTINDQRILNSRLRKYSCIIL